MGAPRGGPLRGAHAEELADAAALAGFNLLNLFRISKPLTNPAVFTTPITSDAAVHVVRGQGTIL